MRAHSPRARGVLRERCPRPALRRGGGGPAAPDEPLAPEGAHVLDEREQRLALPGQRVLHARGDLRIGVALHDPLVLESAKAQGERAGADAGKRTLELAEAAASGGEVANHQDGPLLADDVRGGTDRTVLVEGPLGFQVALHEMKYSPGSALAARILAKRRPRRLERGRGIPLDRHQLLDRSRALAVG